MAAIRPAIPLKYGVKPKNINNKHMGGKMYKNRTPREAFGEEAKEPKQTPAQEKAENESESSMRRKKAMRAGK